MPSFDIISELDPQEVRNAIDQAHREIGNRYDFKGTDSSVELGEGTITLRSVSEDRLNAVRGVVEEKFVKRKLSLKGLSWGKVDDAAGGSVRQLGTLAAGISTDKAKEINKHIKGLGLKGVQSQLNGEVIRVSSKKRDDLQATIAALRDADFGIPLDYQNFRD